MSEKVVVVFELESRQGQTPEALVTLFCRTIDWVNKVVKENNDGGKHLGLIARVVNHQVHFGATSETLDGIEEIVEVQRNERQRNNEPDPRD